MPTVDINSGLTNRWEITIFVLGSFPGQVMDCSIISATKRVVICQGRILASMPVLMQILLYCWKIFYDITLCLYLHKIIFIIPKVPRFYMLYLLINNNGAYDQDDGNRKLCYH